MFRPGALKDFFWGFYLHSALFTKLRTQIQRFGTPMLVPLMFDPDPLAPQPVRVSDCTLPPHIVNSLRKISIQPVYLPHFLWL